MKKGLLALALMFVIGLQAQQEYNKWSVDLGAGVNKPLYSFTSGYSSSTPNLWSATAGVRYMFNNKFGLRLAGGYDSFQESKSSKKFDSNFWNVNLQGVVNVGRVLNFEDWTSDLGLLAHAGFGYGHLNADRLSGPDRIAFATAGVTPQLRISNRIALLADASIFFNAKQQNTFDTFSKTTRRGIQGVDFVVTAGLQIALGKHGKHADWHYSATNQESEVKERIASLEDSVASLQREVSGKQNRMNDANGNNVPDEIEAYLNENYATKASANNANIGDDVAADLIRKGYINAYFDFNSSKPQISSTWATDFVARFLKANSGARVHVVGFADELGGTNYNHSLSLKRAESIKQLLIDAGIDGSRVTTEGKGEDNSVNKNSPRARQIARKATFELK